MIEVFSPPRFAPVVQGQGLKALSVDLQTRWDLSRASDRAALEQLIRQSPPKLLVLCPPCTDKGGWFNLNRLHMDPMEYLRRKSRSRSFIKCYTKLFRIQCEAGGRAVFEHPSGSRAWTYPEMQTLCRRYHLVKCHMCRYGLRIPSSKHLIKKSTKLLVSHADMGQLARECPGVQDAEHECHDTIAGTHPTIGSISTFAGKYTREFVESVLQTVPSLGFQESLVVVHDQASSIQLEEVLMNARDTRGKSDAELLPVLQKLHRNLGHPPNHDLVRLLKHGNASEQAIQLACTFTCDFCRSHARPSVALPAQLNKVVEFNHQVGMDVKHLPGWLPNQKIKALNVVDQASCFQRMVPLREKPAKCFAKSLDLMGWGSH